MKIVFNERAWEEYIYWESENKNMVKKINELIKDIIKNPYIGIGKPEKLKYDKKEARPLGQASQSFLKIFYFLISL